MIRELDHLHGANSYKALPINKETFMRGDISFFPICNRSISDYGSSESKPYSLTFVANMRPNAAQDATGVIFYKTRNKWSLNLNVGGIRKI